jgi:hypothetical protein
MTKEKVGAELPLFLRCSSHATVNALLSTYRKWCPEKAERYSWIEVFLG